MKYTIIILFGVLSTFSSFAQPSIEWQKCLGSTADDYANAIVQTFDNGYAVIGTTADSSNGDVTGTHGYGDLWLAKLSSSGSLQWEKAVGGSRTEIGSCVRQTADSGYIVCGYSESNDGDVSGNHGSFDYWVVKLSSSGNIQWQRSYGGSLDEYANSIRQTSDGGYIIVGTGGSTDGDVTGSVYRGYWVVKISPLGDIQWQKSFGGNLGGTANSVAQTIDSGYILAGVTESNIGDAADNHGLQDSWIVKLSSAGNVQWKRCYGGSGNDEAHSIIQTIDGGYLFAGYSNSTDGDVSGNHGYYDVWVVKLSSLGIIQWQRSHGGLGADEAFSVWQTADSNYAIAGFSNTGESLTDITHGAGDGWLVQLSSTGDLIWQSCLGGSNQDKIFSMQQVADHGFIAAGYTASNYGDVSGLHGTRDYWVVKLAALSGINETPPSSLVTIAPNPTTSLISIQGTENATIKICNILGQPIKEEHNTTTISIADCPPGMYFISIFNQQGLLLKQDKIIRQ